MRPTRSSITFFLVVALSSAPAFAQAFDPRSVRSADCEANYDCGYQPAPAEQQRAVPEAPYVASRGLPSSVDLSPRMPPPGNQGSQNSCVAWASAYALKSYHENLERQWGYDPPTAGGQGEKVFSPAFIYNQINGGRDKGSYIHQAMALFVQQGAAPWKYMPYSARDYLTQPSQQARQVAAKYRARSYFQLRYDDFNGIKNTLNSGNALVLGMPIDDAFYQLKANVYDQQGGKSYGGHAMTIVGYDDNRVSPRGDKGAFKLLNSWGTGWGDRGYGWVSYRMWVQLAPQVMGMTDVQDSKPEPAEVENEIKISAPAQISATRGTYADRVAVTWSSVRGAAAYTIFRAVGSGAFEETGNSETTTYVDKSVQPDVAYRYRIVSVGEDSESSVNESPTAEGFARKAVQTQTTVPDRVVGLKARVDTSSGRPAVLLTWTASAGATSYKVAAYDAATKTWRNAGDARAASFKDANPAERSYYAVQGVSAAGKGKWSDPVEVTAGTREDQAPSIPSNVRASAGTFKDKIVVEWNAVPGAKTYQVYRYNEESDDWDGPVEVNTARLVDDHESVKSGEAFYYTVTASNSAGTSDYCEPVEGSTNPNMERAGEVLSPPANVRAELNQEKKTIHLSWDAVKGSDEYYVFRKKKGDSNFTFAGQSTKTEYSESLPGKPGEIYIYVVRSKPFLGKESQNSEPVAGFIAAVRPQAAHRFMPGLGLDNFTGTWKGQIWDGRSAPKPVSVEVQGNGADFTATVKLPSGARQIKGSFPAGAEVLSADGLQMRIIGEMDLARVEVTGAAGEELVFSVARDKK
jgi:C1A family cysteine protease/fibronectin type 3 domain-containing protein